MELFAMITQFVLGLSLIVGLHELGHMLLAKLFGMRVEAYSIGFPPKLLRFKWGETEYSLGAIPLGGFAKIAGMLDESLDTSSPGSEPQPWEFRAKPAWQRLLVIMGGILFNIMSGLLIYIVLTFSLGDTYLSKNEVNKHGIIPSALGSSLGFQEGDQIININGKDFEKFTDVMAPSTLLKTGGYYTVVRNGQEVQIAIPPDLIEKLAAAKDRASFVAPLVPFSVGQVQKHSKAAQAGLQKGDQLIEVAGKATPYLHQLKAVWEAHAGQKVTLSYLRDGIMHHTNIEVDTIDQFGCQLTTGFLYEKINYTLWQAIAVGSCQAFDVGRTTVVTLGKIFTGKIAPSKALSGPIGIAKTFGSHFDWVKFWYITGLLSIVLAFSNILPIPALDGGHALFILYEMLVGRRLSDKFLEIMQKIGLIILLTLMGYAIFNDLYKLC